MKKIFLSLILLGAVLSANAQGHVGTFSFIPKVGVSLSNISGDGIVRTGDIGPQATIKSKFKAGVTAGADVEYQYSKQWGFAIGAMYTQKGALYDDYSYTPEEGDGIGENKRKMQMDYIDVPLTANFYVGQGFAIKAGVQCSFLINAKYSYDATPFTVAKDGSKTYQETTSKDIKMKDDSNSVCFSIPLAISYEYLNVIIEARYNLPLSDTFSADPLNGRNKCATFTVGYRL